MKREQRWFWTSLIISMLIGYGFGLMQIAASSGFRPGQILEHFQGNEAEMIFGLGYAQLVKLSHIHLFGMPLILTPSAWVFSHTLYLTRKKRDLIIVAGFLGIVCDVAAWWGLVYFGFSFLPLLMTGGILLAGSLLTMSVLDLRWLWKSSTKTKSTD